MRDAQFAEAVAVRQVGHEVHLFGGGVARRHAGFFQRQHHGRVAGLLVRLDVALDPVGERLVVGVAGVEIQIRQLLVSGRHEPGGDAAHLVDGQRFRTIFQVGPFGFDLAREFFDADGFQQDLDARLVLVVAAAVLVIHAHHGFGVGQQMLPRQEVADHAAEDGRAAHAAAGHEFEADFASLVAHHGQADVVHGDGGAVRPMSCTAMAARSSTAPLMATLNLRGNAMNSGWKVLHWRSSSAYGRGSMISSAATPAYGSEVVLLMQLPDVWMACISTEASSLSMSGVCSSSTQLNWMFWRVVKWP